MAQSVEITASILDSHQRASSKNGHSSLISTEDGVHWKKYVTENIKEEKAWNKLFA